MAMKRCPFCAEEIQAEAIKCRYCGSSLADRASAGPAVRSMSPSQGEPADHHETHEGAMPPMIPAGKRQLSDSAVLGYAILVGAVFVTLLWYLYPRLLEGKNTDSAPAIQKMSTEDSKKQAASPSPKPNPALSTKLPISVSPEEIAARVNYRDGRILVTNLNTYDWLNTEFQINSGIINSGYFLKVACVKSEASYVAGIMEFANKKGERFNPFSMKAREFVIIAHRPDGTTEVASFEFP